MTVRTSTHHLQSRYLIRTHRKEWEDTRIIKAYRSQYIIEGVFKEMKDRVTGSWWPMTDSNISVAAKGFTAASGHAGRTPSVDEEGSFGA